MKRFRSSSTEEIFSRRTDYAGRGNLRRAVTEAANDNCRISGGFAHQQARRGGQFVGNRENGGAKQSAVAIALAAKIEQRGDTGRADGDVCEAETPRAAKSIADDHSQPLTGLFTQSRSESASRAVWIFRQKRHRVVPGNVGMVHTGVGADEAVMRFDNQHAFRTQNAARLTKNHFYEARIT